MDTDLERLHRELEAALERLTESNIVQAPAGKWNSAQILEHLYLTYKNTNKGIAICLEKGAPLATQATIKHRLMTFVVVVLGYMPGGLEAPGRVLPRGIPFAEVRSIILAEIRSMDSGFEACERRFGAGTKIMDHPILGPLTAKQWRKFHWVHGRHHAKQIRERAKL